jgi:hypothetical protein
MLDSSFNNTWKDLGKGGVQWVVLRRNIVVSVKQEYSMNWLGRWETRLSKKYFESSFHTFLSFTMVEEMMKFHMRLSQDGQRWIVLFGVGRQ